MSFAVIQQKVPVKPERLQLILTVTLVAGQPNKYEGTYRFDIKTTDGEILESRQGDAVPHYTTAERAQFAALLDKGLTLARTTVP